MASFTAFSLFDTQAEAEIMAEALENLDPKPVAIACLEVEDGSETFEVGGYFDEKPDIAALFVLNALYGGSDFVISKLDNRDWVAQVQRELTPVDAGRFLVYGSHDKENVSPHRIGLQIEAAMAFGTGHHATTLGCLLMTEDLHREGFSPRLVADIGTGTGVLAMAAAKLWKKAHIVASDIEDMAVATARANFRANNIGQQALCFASRGFDHAAYQTYPEFDLIYANILASPLRRLAPKMAYYTHPGARIVLSGILKRQGQAVIATYQGHGFSLVKKRVIGDWVTLMFERHS